MCVFPPFFVGNFWRWGGEVLELVIHDMFDVDINSFWYQVFFEDNFDNYYETLYF